MAKSGKPQIFYGYIVIAAAFLILTIAWGSNRSFAVFLQPMLEETGWSRAGLSGAFAMCISGISGAYMTESAEREREMKSLERAMLTKMEDDSMHREASKFATILTSIVDGFSPALAALIVISPFFMVNVGWITMETAFPASISMTMIVLLVLGLYLAKISDQSLAKYGLRMLIVGLVTALMCAGVAIMLGAPAV